MEKWLSLFNENSAKFLDELIQKYQAAIEKATNKEFVHKECENTALKNYDFIQQNDNLLHRGQIFTIITIISDMKNRDKTPFNNAFEQITKDYTLKEQKIIINKIAKIEAYSKFCNDFLPEKEKEFEKFKLSKLELISEAANIFGDLIRNFLKLPSKDISKEDLDNWVKEDIKEATGEIAKKLAEFETTKEQHDFLHNKRDEIIAASFPIISNELQGENIEPYLRLLYEKMSEKIENIIGELNKKVDTKTSSNEVKDEATIRQQVLAIYYLLDEFKACNTDKTEIARFIQFLTGKELGIDKIADTNIYKIVKRPFSNAIDKDLLAITPYFKKMGMADIVIKIEGDMVKNK